MRLCLISVLLSAVFLLNPACTRQAGEVSEPGPVHQSHSVTGVVMSVHKDQGQTVVKHEKIPGYMMAMTMPFTVADTNALTGLIPGEEITFQMIVTEDDAWIEDIEKTGVAENILPAGRGIRIAREVEPLEVGDALPDYSFLNQEGQAVHLNQFRGQSLLLSFIFTRCPLPNFCPLTARKLAEVQNRLLANPGAPTNWHLVTLTIDPEFDTSARLKQFGETYGYNPDHWSLLTGELIDITALAEQFGLLFWTAEGTLNHNLRTVLVGADGVIRTNRVGNDWDVEGLVGEVIQGAAP